MHAGSPEVNALKVTSVLTAVILPLLFLALLSCGRRGDPVLIEPHIQPEIKQTQDADKAETGIQKKSLPVDNEVLSGSPSAPVDLIGVYTGSSIVLTWNVIIEKGISLYKIYRSEGDEPELIGESMTPAFTDRDVKAGRQYFYRVSAVAGSESPLSEPVLVSTEE